MYTLTLPSGAQAEIREMTGVEEDLLTNEKLMRTGNAINQILLNCLVSLNQNRDPQMADVLDLLAGDRLFLLVKLREVSLGETLDLTLKCTNRACGHPNFASVNLTCLAVTSYGEARELTVTLPGSGKEVVYNHLDGHGEKRLASMNNPDATALMLLRIISIEGKPPNKKALRNMSIRDRQHLRAEMQKTDGGPDTIVTLECDGCGALLQTRIEGEPDFLFPGVR